LATKSSGFGQIKQKRSRQAPEENGVGTSIHTVFGKKFRSIYDIFSLFLSTIFVGFPSFC
jgi:hypothetical protein